MNEPSASIVQLRYLVAALEHRSWREAAEQVGVSPSAFSQGLAELERRIGLALFERRGRGRAPTPEAEIAGGHARTVLAELAELERWAVGVREGTEGRLRIGMIDTAAVWHFGDALMQYRARHPDVAVRLSVQPSGRLSLLLAEGALDIIVAVAGPPAPGVVSRPLVVEPIYVYAPPGTPVTSPQDWGPWVSFPAESRTRALIGRALRGQGVEFEVVAESSQPAVLREMVQLGMGWTALASVDAEREPHALRRARPEPVAERTLSLSRRDREPTAALARLIDALVVAAERRPGSGR